MKAIFAKRGKRKGYRRNPPRLAADKVAAHELVLFIVNDGALYRGQTSAIIANLRKKKAKGTYSPALAAKLYAYLAKTGADKYAKEYGGSSAQMFTPATRMLAAREMEEHYRDEVAYRPNPSPKVPTYFVVASPGFREGYVFLQDARGMVARNPLNAKRFRSKVAAQRFLESFKRDRGGHGLFVARIRRFPHGISMDK